MSRTQETKQAFERLRTLAFGELLKLSIGPDRMLTVMRTDAIHEPQRRYNLVFERSDGSHDRTENHEFTSALVEIDHFLNPPRSARDNPQWTAEELARLGPPTEMPYQFKPLVAQAEWEALKAWSAENPLYTAIAEKVAAEKARRAKAEDLADRVLGGPSIFARYFNKPSPQDFVVDRAELIAANLGPPVASGRAILAQMQEEDYRARRELEDRFSWALTQAKTAWPRPTWALKTTGEMAGLLAKIEAHYTGPDYDPIAYHIQKWRRAIHLTDATPEILAEHIARAKGHFCDHLKTYIRDAKRSDAVLDEVSSWGSEGSREYSVVDRLLPPSTPGHRLAAAFAVPLPHDSDELHDRLFVGPRARMEDVRGGR